MIYNKLQQIPAARERISYLWKILKNILSRYFSYINPQIVKIYTEILFILKKQITCKSFRKSCIFWKWKKLLALPETFSNYSYYENITQVYKRELHLNFKTFSQWYNTKIHWKHFSVILIVHFDPFFTFYILFNLDHGLPSKNSRISGGEKLRYTIGIHFNEVDKINKNIYIE